jgi:hypothetical protein
MFDAQQEKRTSRLSALVSFTSHALLLGGLFFFAAREGILGKQLKKIAVTMVPKEKPPEKPKEPAPEKKPPPELPKAEAAPVAAAAPQVQAPRAAAATAPTVAPAIAPPAAESATFDFEGGKAVETSSDPNVLYKGTVEYTLRSRWVRPEGVADTYYVAEVEVAIDREGKLLRSQWKKGSGDRAWDDSVKKALAETRSIGRPPPKGFPDKVLVRFDVQTVAEIGIE